MQRSVAAVARRRRRLLVMLSAIGGLFAWRQREMAKNEQRSGR
jgi:hypothetical protein